MDCTFEAEKSFGPSVASCRRPFDFTLTFGEIFFKILPSAIFIIAALIRLAVLLRRRPCVSLGVLGTLKISTTSIFAVLELVVLISTVIGNQGRTQVSEPAAILAFVAASALLALSHFEHTRSVRSSYLLGLYLVITTILRSATVRSYWLIENFGTIASVSLASLLVQIAVLVLESCSKRRWIIDKSRGGASAEEAASFLGRSLFTWLNDLMLTGYRRKLTTADLHIIDKCLSSQANEDKFSRILTTKKYGGSGYGLCFLSLRCLGLYAFTPVIPRLTKTAFTFAQPFLASALIEYLDDQQSASYNNGYGLIGASFLVYTGIAVSSGWYWQMNYKCVGRTRAGLIDAVSQKMLRIKPEKAAESKILTLVVNDVQRVTGNLIFIHEIWIAPIETGLGSYLLWRQVGPSSLTVLGVVLLCLAGSLFIGKHSAKQQGAWLAATEARIAATKQMLASLKAIKMTGADRRASSVIEKLRELEFAASKMFRTLLVGGLFSAFATLTLAPAVVFGSYVAATAAQQQDIDAARLFSSLILITLVASPLILVLQYIPQLGAMIGCFVRLKAFFEREEKSESRSLLRHRTTDLAEISDTNTGSEDLATKSEKRTVLERPSPYDVVVFIRDGNFGWGDEALLKDVNLKIGTGEHIVITGPVGCGKSLLLHGIMGELEPKSGKVQVRDTGVAYCGQVAWLENASARSNALRFAPLHDDWHRRVIEACALRELLDSQAADETIGSNGAKISGGERQRLAIARAIALRPALLLLDDVFSALDRSTKSYILERVFGPKGLLTELGTTVIQITQDSKCAQYADRILTVEDGRLTPFEFVTATAPRMKGTVEAEAEAQDRASIDGDVTKPRQSEKQHLPDASDVGDRQVYRAYGRSIGRKHLTISLVCSAAFAFTVKFPNIWAQWWAADGSNPDGQVHSTGYWIGLYVFLSFLPLIIVCGWIAHLLLIIVPKSGMGLHSKILNSVLRSTFVFISGIDTGDLINRFSQDLMLVDIKLPLDLANTASEFFTVIVQVILVAVAAIYVLASIPVLILALFFLQHFYLRTSKQLRQLDLQSKAGLQSKTSESYLGLTTIRAHGWQSVFMAELRDQIDRTQEPFYLLWMVQTWLQLVLNLIVAGMAVIVAGVAVATKNTTSGAAIGVAFLNLVSLGEALTRLISSWTSLETSLGAIARIESFERNTPTEPAVDSPTDVSPEWPVAGELILEGVHATYFAGSDKPQWSLEDIDLHIKAGEKVAVCGRTGSGKSTLLLSLLALIDTPRGTISLDGVDISRVPQTLLRSRYHVISQDTLVQNEGVREALDPDGLLSDEAIVEVLKECAILDKINAGGGLSGNLGDASLSVGESQLFVLARTIIQAGNRPGGVILLDEATSSVDVATEQRIMRLIAEKLQGKTIISVLHRLEAALAYDRIIVLEKGRVAHSGTPDEIIQVSDLFSSFREPGKYGNT